MLSLPKIGVVAGLVALGVTAFSAAPAEASYFAQRCNEDGCYRVRCHDDGFGCVRASSYYSSDYMAPAPRYYDPDTYYHPTARYLCNSDGEYCRWTNTYRDGDEFY